MFIIHTQDERTGSVDWEFPPYMNKLMAQYPQHIQEKIRGVLEDRLKQWLLILLTGVSAPDPQHYYDATQKYLDDMVQDAQRIMKKKI